MPGPLLAANAAQIVHVVQQRVHERARVVARGGVDDHARGLVDDHDVRVLVDDRQVEILGGWRGVLELGDVELDRCARLEPVIRFREAAVDLDEALLDQLLEMRARLARDAPTQESGRGAGRRTRPERLP